jgi:hypothetical protein
MKEAFEDRMTIRIKEVMEQYEPEYSPQAWKGFQKYIHKRESWLKNFFRQYPYWFDGIIITIILSAVFNVSSQPVPENKATVVIPHGSDSVNYPESEKTKEVTILEKPVPFSHIDSKEGTTSGEESVFLNYLPVHINDSLPTNYINKNQIENKIQGKPDSTEKIPDGSDLFRVEGFSNQFNNKLLIPLQLKIIEIPSLTSHTSDRLRKLKLKLPDLNLLTAGSKKYNKFIGPNKFALFYSPEIHHTDSLKTLGISHGFGIIVEGPIRSFISISAGLSYQSMNFNKTISSGQVLRDLPPLYRPIDSIFIRSCSYKYLELPVSINLKLLKSTRSQVWLGTGISVMAFLKQNYESDVIYRDTCKGTQDFIKKVEFSANAWKNIHPLASVNFSLQYRFEFTNRLFLHSSIQYKLHLVPLGCNSMKLNRINLQIGLGYRFGRDD